MSPHIIVTVKVPTDKLGDFLIDIPSWAEFQGLAVGERRHVNAKPEVNGQLKPKRWHLRAGTLQAKVLDYVRTNPNQNNGSIRDALVAQGANPASVNSALHALRSHGSVILEKNGTWHARGA